MASQADGRLRTRLNRLRADHEDQWAYSDRSSSSSSHSVLFQYPAMMVADMQRDLTAALLAQTQGKTGPIFDPFIGSGTVLTAGMALGHDIVGWDVNPLAILICRVKGGPFHLNAFADAAARAIPEGPLSGRPEQRFDNWGHWFTRDVALGLTALRRRIRDEPRVATRRFLWLCLAETVRLTSNSRTSTVKLHRRPLEQVESRPDPRHVFKRVATANVKRLGIAAKELSDAGVLSRGWYRGSISLQLGDTCKLGWRGPPSALVVTSPPYGDNTSTVPYGQHAYLPLQWIDLLDIDPGARADCLSSTYEIDRRSLGGKKAVDPDDQTSLRERSRALNGVIEGLAREKRDRRNRVLAFTRDLDKALGVIAGTLQQGGLAAWTVGSRRVGCRVVPLERMLVELASGHGFSHIETLHRDIPPHRKRMASRNRTGATMQREHVVVLRRVAS